MNAEDVYTIFQKAKSRYFGKPYYAHKLFPPKEPDFWSVKKQGGKRITRKFFTFEEADTFMKENRGKGYSKHYHKGRTLNDDYLESLDILSRRFSTVWANIDPDIYFDCGFEIFGEKFCYLNFFDKRITRLYIIKDKNKKLHSELSKKELLNSAKFVLTFLKENNIRFNVYCLMKDGYALPVLHYMKNHINEYFLVWLLKERFLRINDDDRAVIPHVTQNYVQIVQKLNEVKTFCDKMKEKFI